MFTIDDVFVYLIIIIGVIYIIHIYNKMQHTGYPIMEGLTNSVDKKVPGKVTGLNSGSVEFNQDISGLIAITEVELNINKYSDQYLEILQNLKELYARKALTLLLQPMGDNMSYINMATQYKMGIECIEKIIPILSKSNSSLASAYTSKFYNSNSNKEDAEADPDAEEDDPPKSKWLPSW